MSAINIFVETGKKRTFAGAVDWPGWCRGGKDAEGALAALLAYGPRYAGVLQRAEMAFEPPSDLGDFQVVEEQPGGTTTDFGAPEATLEADQAPFDHAALAQALPLLGACWAALDAAIAQAAGKELRKGPRGGGRDVPKMVHHVLEAEAAYLRKLAWKYSFDPAEPLAAAIQRIQAAGREALEAAASGKMPAAGPRGGALWSPHFYARRSAWHILDHAWEIEDRIV